MVLKSSQGLNSTSLGGGDTISWLTPSYFGDITNLNSVSAFGKAYDSVIFDSILIRSVIDRNKRVSWKHPTTYPNLYSIISSKTSIRNGVLISGSPSQLDYISGCLTGNEPPSRYYGFYVGDNGPFTINLLNKSFTSWGGAIIGWGSTNYTNNYNVSGGFGFSQYFGQNLELSRHYHWFGNACNVNDWNGSTGNAVFNSHGLFIR